MKMMHKVKIRTIIIVFQRHMRKMKNEFAYR